MILFLLPHITAEIPKIKPMVIAIWCGNEKPKNLNDYLLKFVNELNHVLSNGITINGYQLTVNFHCFVCDTPARAFLKGKIIFYLLLA